MTVTATFTFPAGGLTRGVLRPGGDVDREIHARALRVDARAKQTAPVDTGRLRAAIHVDGPFLTADTISYDVVSPTFYTTYLEFGTEFIDALHFMENALDAARG